MQQRVVMQPETTDRWADAVDDVRLFNQAYAKVLKKPNDEKLLRTCLSGIMKRNGLGIWAMQCLPQSGPAYLEFRRCTRALNVLQKDKAADPKVVRSTIGEFVAAAQGAIDSAAPGAFHYHGFKVSNPQHVDETMCRTALQGIDFIVGLFKRRGVLPLLGEGLSKIVLLPELEYGALGRYEVEAKEILLNVGKLADGASHSTTLLDDFVNETFLHEFGHYVHLHYIRGEAKDAWDAPWAGIPDRRKVVDTTERDKRLAPLEPVSEYAKYNEKEDFAETFVAFIAAPEKLTPTAKFRMQRALSLSGFYGKPVMRLARIVERFLAG